jgi:hypothetical protein
MYQENEARGEVGVEKLFSGRLSRRAFLKGAGMAAVGASLTASSLSFFQQKTAGISCCDLSVISKHISGAVENFEYTVCEYYGQKVWRISADLQGELLAVECCDETGGSIAEGSTLEASEIEHSFRLNSPCEKPVGMFRSLGLVRIKHPSGKILAESRTPGAMRGTFGFDHRAAEPARRCCDFPWGIGSLELEGYRGSELEGCLVQATFQVNLPIEPQQLYEGIPWEAWSADLEGNIVCPF